MNQQHFIFLHIVHIYLHTPPINKFLNAFCKKIMLAAVQATDEELIALPYLMRISYTKRVLLVL